MATDKQTCPRCGGDRMVLEPKTASRRPRMSLPCGTCDGRGWVRTRPAESLLPARVQHAITRLTEELLDKRTTADDRDRAIAQLLERAGAGTRWAVGA